MSFLTTRGLLCIDPDQVAGYVALGASFVGVGVDTAILTRGARQLAERFKST